MTLSTLAGGSDMFLMHTEIEGPGSCKGQAEMLTGSSLVYLTTNFKNNNALFT